MEYIIPQMAQAYRMGSFRQPSQRSGFWDELNHSKKSVSSSDASPASQHLHRTPLLSGEEKRFLMPHNTFQKYFNLVIAWSRDVYVRQVGDYTDLLVAPRRWGEFKILERTQEHDFCHVLDSQGKHMAQRAAMGEIDDNSKSKKTWISIEMPATKPIDTFPR